MTLLAILGLGFVLGLRHATDADHVVTITTLMSRERSARAALGLGALWGLGHSLTLLVVGGTIVVFGFVVPARLGLSMELSVALMLILLGALNLTGAGERLRAARAHTHTSDEQDSGTWTTSALGVLRRGSRSVLIGVVHGLAGSAAVALLVLTTLDRADWALTYLAIFGLGTVAGMMLITVTMALPIKLAVERFASAERLMARASGALSLAFGIFLAYRIGFVDGLFVGVPRWTPE